MRHTKKIASIVNYYGYWFNTGLCTIKTNGIILLYTVNSAKRNYYKIYIDGL
jgi:hypothetical protein